MDKEYLFAKAKRQLVTIEKSFNVEKCFTST